MTPEPSRPRAVAPPASLLGLCAAHCLARRGLRSGVPAARRRPPASAAPVSLAALGLAPGVVLAGPRTLGLGCAAPRRRSRSARPRPRSKRCAYESRRPARRPARGRGSVTAPRRRHAAPCAATPLLRDGRLRSVLDVRVGRERGRAASRSTGRVRVEVGGDAPKPSPVSTATASRCGRRCAPALDAPRVRCRGRSASARAARLVERLRRVTRRGRLRRLAARALRERGACGLRRAMPPGPEQGLVRAMVLGDRSGIDPATAEAFRIAGTYHVLALSGAQVALVAALLVAWRCAALPAGALSRRGVLRSRSSPTPRSSAATCRSCARRVMAAACSLGRALDLDARRRQPARARGARAARPSAVASATSASSSRSRRRSGSSLLTPPLTAALPRCRCGSSWRSRRRWRRSAALLPLLAAHFHRLAPAALLLNLVAVPLAAAVLLAGFAVLALRRRSALGAAVGRRRLARAPALLRSGDLGPAARLARRARARAVRSPCSRSTSPAWRCCCAGRRLRGLALLGRGARWPRARAPGARRRRPAAPHGPRRRARATRSCCARPRGRAWWSTPAARATRASTWARARGPVALAHGVRRLDGARAHPRPSRSRRRRAVPAARFGVARVWEGPAAPGDPSWRRFAATLDRAGVPRVALARAARYEWDGARLLVLGPGPPAAAPPRVRNDDSVVVEVGYGAVRAAARPATSAAEAEGPLATHAVDVVKVAHHGSRTSSSRRLTRPRVPPRRRLRRRPEPFGHPHPEVVERYPARGRSRSPHRPGRQRDMSRPTAPESGCGRRGRVTNGGSADLRSTCAKIPALSDRCGRPRRHAACRAARRTLMSQSEKPSPSATGGTSPRRGRPREG